MSDYFKHNEMIYTILLTVVIFSLLATGAGCMKKDDTKQTDIVNGYINISGINSSQAEHTSVNSSSQVVSNKTATIRTNSTDLVSILKQSGKGKSDLPPPPKPN
jgi:hypothetical protein